jgi:hypothetical protein
MAVRPLARGMRTWDLESMSISPQRARIAGKACIELSRREGASLQRNWVCPELGYHVVRRLSTIKDKVTLKLDINYRQDPTIGWAPANWTVLLSSSDGFVTDDVRGALVEFTANPPVTDADFDIDFPPGTYVNDQTKRPAEFFIVKADGTKRPVSRKELDKTYEELLNSDPPTSPDGRRTWWPILLAVGVGVASLGVLLGRRMWRQGQAA